MNLKPLTLVTLSALAAAQEPLSVPKVPRQPVAGNKGVDPVEIFVPHAPMPAGFDTTLAPANREPVAVLPAGSSAREAPLAVLFDQPNADELWAAAPMWKAGFDGSSATFVPFFGSGAARNHPAKFRVREVNVGGHLVPTPDGKPERHDATIVIARGGMIEQYVASLQGIEQRFVFEKLPTTGELTVTIGVDGGYVVESAAGGHRFACALGSFSYGRAIAFDASGATSEVQSQWTGDAIRLTVPAAFVAAARMPLTIDPLIGNTVQLASSTFYDTATTDIAFDASLQQYVVCWERIFSLTDSDVLMQRCNADMQPIGSPVFVDNTPTSWRHCRIAGLDMYDKFLIVAECEQAANPIYVAGRVVDGAAWTLTGAFDIERGAIACGNPDVGGDAYPTGPVYWSVVYERRYTPYDYDIALRQVQQNATLRGGTFSYISSSFNIEHSPVISNSDGGDGSPGSQRWCIAYRQRNNGYQEAIRTATVSWDGLLDPQQTTSGYYYADDTMDLTVSSPTLASLGRNFLVAVTIYDHVFHRNLIRTLVVGPNATVISPWNVVFGYLADCGRPVVDSDGVRFAMSYAIDPDQSNPPLHAATIDLVGNALTVHDDQTYEPQTIDVFGQAMCSEVSGGASNDRQRRYAMSWIRQDASSSQVRTTRYAGVATNGGASVRGTGCSNFGLQIPSGFDFAAIGSSIELGVGTPGGVIGWGVGAPISAPIPGCSMCVLGTTAAVVLIGDTIDVTLPPNTALVGATFAFQAFRLDQTGNCFGSLDVSDTVDVTIR